MPSALRELKKERTRAAIQSAALALIAEQGYSSTTCEQIAHRAEVSPATFFRYFSTKEDVVLRDDYDPMIFEAVRARPAREGPMLAVRRGLADTLSGLEPAEMEAARARTKLIMSEPQLRRRSDEQVRSSREALAAALAERLSHAVQDLEIQALAAACTSALAVAVEHWAEHDGRLADYVDEALSAITGGRGPSGAVS